MEKLLSLQINQQQPKSVTIEEGKFYAMDGGTQCQIVKIRTNGDQIMIYYRTAGKQRFFSYTKSWNYNSLDLESFKGRLLDLGSITKLTVNPLRNWDK